jgi:anti-sigma regulatory factor (Ser/Thr protein kinase)
MGPLSTADPSHDHVVQFCSRDAKPKDCTHQAGAITARGAPRNTTRTFPAHVNSPSAARHFVLENLKGWADDELLADAAVVVTELATNAVVHARSEFTVEIAPVEAGVRISVLDCGPDQWVGKAVSFMASHGRGLGLVAALSRSWGKSARDGGKVVWAELTVNPSSSRTSATPKPQSPGV